jgi:hypothetical protein
MLEEVTPRPQAPRGPRPIVAALPVVLVIWGFVGVYLLQLSLDRKGETRMREKMMAELAFFPSGQFVRQAAFEYRELAADLVWLRAIQYYGYHLMSDHKYEWLGHVFGILTTLDPRFVGAYHFGAMTLAWDARKPQEAIDFLVSGMQVNPLSWQLPFDAGFISYMVLKDYERASALFNIASKMPDAWFISARWAAISKAKAGDFETARQMWLDIYNGTENRALRALVVRQLKNLKFEESLGLLQKAVQKFQEDRKRYPTGLRELIDAGYLDRVPEEPYGGRFMLKDGKVQSTTPVSQRE